jgi:hypothetical protein
LRRAVAKTVRGKPVRRGCFFTLYYRTSTGFPSLKINEIGLNAAPFGSVLADSHSWNSLTLNCFIEKQFQEPIKLLVQL